VWLPPGYSSDGKRRYPVLYMHDGQNLFDSTAAGAEWQLDEAAEQGVRGAALAPMIIVAVASTGQRIHDYTPVPGRAGGQTVGGGAADYARYLLDELKPLIDSRYRTLPGREHTAVGGSSLGGLVSLWLVLTQGQHFGAALVVSPSVWWAERDILRQLRLPAGAGRVPKLWLDMGSEEGPRALQDVRELRDALAERGWAPVYSEHAGAGHDEVAWAARVPLMLRFLYPPR
jgi:predicted alpha/beta superfamily hydrolase